MSVIGRRPAIAPSDRCRRADVNRHVDLSNCNMNGSILNGENLSGADPNNTNRNCSDMIGVDLSGAKMKDPVLTQANLEGATISQDQLATAFMNIPDCGRRLTKLSPNLKTKKTVGFSQIGELIARIPNVSPQPSPAVQPQSSAVVKTRAHRPHAAAMLPPSASSPPRTVSAVAAACPCRRTAPAAPLAPVCRAASPV